MVVKKTWCEGISVGVCVCVLTRGYSPHGHEEIGKVWLSSLIMFGICKERFRTMFGIGERETRIN